jgi:hypothetical protein
MVPARTIVCTPEDALRCFIGSDLALQPHALTPSGLDLTVVGAMADDVFIMRRPKHENRRMERALALAYPARRHAVLFWSFLLCVAVGGLAIIIAFGAYWTVPPIPMRVTGDALTSYDPDMGFVQSPIASSHRVHLGADGRPVMDFHLYTDARGARVSHPGESSPARPDILFVGDSFTWGHGVENEDTFAVKTAAALGFTQVNFALGSYGTTQAVQSLQRNRDLRPRIVVYPFIMEHLRRNVALCAPSYYPFCLDYSHVVSDGEGNLSIGPPVSNGLRRTLVHAEAQTVGIGPVTWVIHGLDVIYGRILASISDWRDHDPEFQQKALTYLLGRMAGDAKSLDAELVIVYIPYRAISPAPKLLGELAHPLGYRFLDLTNAFTAAGPKPLHLPDGHPNPAGHTLIAQELASFIRQSKARN